MLARTLAHVRQLFFPKEFRIAAPVWPEGWRGIAEKCVSASGSVGRIGTGPTDNPAATEKAKGSGGGSKNMRAPKQWLDLLATLATGIWRLQQRLGPAGAGGSEMRKAVRELESLWDTLGEAGVRIIDPTGDVYDPGQSLKVIAFQPTAGIDRERIVETLKPTVYLGDEWIQMAEVIVGTPKKEDA